MFLKRRKVKGITYWSIAESYRADGKVKQRVILHLGNTAKAISILSAYPEYQQFLYKIIESQM